jgi:cytochrome P450
VKQKEALMTMNDERESSAEAISDAENRCVIDFDHHSPDLLSQLPELWHNLQSTSPVAWSEANGGYWVVTGYNEVYEIVHDDATFSSDYANGGVLIPPSPFPLGFIETDPPEHNFRREPLNKYLSPNAAEKLEDRIRDIVTAFIDDVIESGKCEFVADVALPIPAALTMEMMGIPTNRWRLSADANHRINTAPPGTPMNEKAVAEMGEMGGELARLIAERRSNGERNDDILDVLCNVKVEGQLVSEESVLADVTLLLNGGVDTIATLLSSSLKWLDQNRDQLKLLRDHPELIKDATEEFLRVFTPVTGLARTCTRDYAIGGQKMKSGDRLLLIWAATNTDPKIFESPDEVRLNRTPNEHMSFGVGAHQCVARNVARVVYVVTLEEILKRMSDISIDHSAAKPYPSIGFNRGWITLPMTFTPGPKLGSEFRI